MMFDQLIKSRINYAIFIIHLLIITPLFLLFAAIGHTAFGIIWAISVPIFIFWPCCTNCNLSLSSGKKFKNTNTGIDFLDYGRRLIPGPCSKCGQDHWKPFLKINDEQL